MRDLSGCLVELSGLSPKNYGFDWSFIHGGLGICLPQDYRNYVEAFPPGTFQKEMISFFHPARSASLQGFIDTEREFCRDLEESWRLFGPGSPLRPYPAPGGIFPWGYIGVDFVLCWRTVGDSDRWNSVIVTQTFDWSHELPLSMTETLMGIFDGSIMVGDLEDELAGPVDFLPYASPLT